jgi:predicted Rossmann fold nucleotide-binding protein DprA/Smf involved in DNA uptake
MLPGECYDLDALVELTGMNGPAILARLTELELAGVVVVSQGRYVRRS